MARPQYHTQEQRKTTEMEQQMADMAKALADVKALNSVILKTMEDLDRQ